MKLIIGGACQGKLAWAKKHYTEITDDGWIDGKTCGLKEINSCGGIYDFHEYIRRVMLDKSQSEKIRLQPDTLAEMIIQNNPDIIIISDEIGYGLVPVDEFDRNYREQTGRICTKLAAFSDQVVRVVMGIGMCIKG